MATRRCPAREPFANRFKVTPMRIEPPSAVGVADATSTATQLIVIEYIED